MVCESKSKSGCKYDNTNGNLMKFTIKDKTKFSIKNGKAIKPPVGDVFSFMVFFKTTSLSKPQGLLRNPSGSLYIV